MIINEAMARKFWPNDDPLSRYLTFNSSTQYEIIGVVSNAKHSSLQEEDEPTAYTSHQQVTSRTMDLAVRANYSFDREPAALINAIRLTVSKIDPEQAIHNIGTMEQRLSQSLRRAISAAVASWRNRSRRNASSRYCSVSLPRSP